MFKKRNLIFICLLILGIFLITSCLPKPPVTEGILKGQVIVPEGSKDLTGQVLADATVNIIDPATGAIIATTTTDTNGYYQVFVPAGGPYILQAVKDGVKVQQITPQVEVGIEYDLGTADCSTTAVALIVQAMLVAEDYPDNLSDINLTDIEADPNFNDVMSIVCNVIEAGGDPAESAVVQQAVEDFLYPPAPAPPPTLTYTVTFDSQGGSPINSQTVAHGGKATEPTAPTWGGYIFGGWYKESGCTNAWDFNTDTVTADVRLYAKWTGSVHNITQDTYYNTIQAALDEAKGTNRTAKAILGDIIEVFDGTYNESITFPSGKMVILRSVNGASSTTITGVDGSATVTCSNSLGGIILVEGFTITHESGKTGRGITITAGCLAIENCVISNNSVTNGYGGGGIYNEATLIITDSEISGNSAPDGGGIYHWYGTLTITGSTISGNSAATDAGGIYNHGTLTITDSTIFGNSASDGGGIYLEQGTVTITGSTISDNSAADYGGGGIYNEATLIITDSEISGNSAPDGGGIYHWYGTLTITGSTISGNSAATDAGGIYNHGTLTITDSTIFGNSASDGGGIYIYDSSPTIQNNTISGNTASTGNGGGIYIESGIPTIGGANVTDTANFNTICGNTPDQINPDSYPNNYISDYCIGDTGPAGGWIFYDNGSYTTATATIPSWRYLEAAPSDQSTSAEWGCYEVLISGADGTAVGTGEQNTIDIEAGCTTANTAADICANLSLGGYDDWFLPSKDELNLMYTNLHTAVGDSVGGFVDDYYWNSSEYDDSHAWIQSFEYGGQFNSNKSGTVRIRAVRAF